MSQQVRGSCWVRDKDIKCVREMHCVRRHETPFYERDVLVVMTSGSNRSERGHQTVTIPHKI